MRYEVPESLDHIETEYALSPDYLQLLRKGTRSLEPVINAGARGCCAGEVQVWITPKGSMKFAKPYQERCGHACVLRLSGAARELGVEIGVVRAEGTPGEKAQLNAGVLEAV